MPLPNRVTPFAGLIAVASRGLFLGNRGGRFHNEDRRLGSRQWASRRWICCQLSFNGRHRTVWGSGYTELFFLDEVTALAAGHRPCFECRRSHAIAFATAWAGAPKRSLPPARDIDHILHAERLEGRTKRRHRRAVDGLPDGVMIEWPPAPGHAACAVRGDWLLRWRPQGYCELSQRPKGIDVSVLTPPSIVAVLSNGYSPVWHQTAGSRLPA